VKWQNGQTQLNRMVNIFNGIGNSTVYMGLGGELNATATANTFDA